MACSSIPSLSWVLSADVSGWDNFTPLNVMLLFLCVYSLVVNYSFGHPTYWRKSSYSSRLNLLGSSPDSAVVAQKAHAARVLDAINTDILIRVLGYLDAYELTQVRQVSRKYDRAVQSNQLWNDLGSYVSENCCLDSSTRSINACPMVRYFNNMEQIMTALLRDDTKLIVKLHGTLYDLTQFAAEHPGGNEVLVEYKGKDATRIFDLASHSVFAREISKNLVLFDPAVYKGARGIPQIMKRKLQQLR